MNVFVSALNAVARHFRVRGHILLISQDHPFSQTEIDLRQVAAHKLPGPATLRLRLFRGRWTEYSMDGFRPREIARLCALLTRWERQNHQKHEPEA
jgi:hypothetical protein